LQQQENELRRFSEFSPNVKTEVIQDAGHDLPISQKDRLHTALFKFLLE
jgi:hypothetical protein